MAGQASACAGVGVAKARLNHRATAGWKGLARLMFLVEPDAAGTGDRMPPKSYGSSVVPFNARFARPRPPAICAAHGRRSWRQRGAQWEARLTGQTAPTPQLLVFVRPTRTGK